MTYPSLWGPAQWRLLHQFCDNADEEPRLIPHLKVYVESLRYLIPCSACLQHFRDNLINMPFPESDFFEWSWRFHNAVNRASGVRELSLEEARIHQDAWMNMDMYLEDMFQARRADFRELKKLRLELGKPGCILAQSGDMAIWNTDVSTYGNPHEPDTWIRLDRKYREAKIGSRLYLCESDRLVITELDGTFYSAIPISFHTFDVVDDVVYGIHGGGLEIFKSDSHELVFEYASVIKAHSPVNMLFAFENILYQWDGEEVSVLYRAEEAVKILSVDGDQDDWAIGTEEGVIRNGDPEETNGNPILSVRIIGDEVAWYDGEVVYYDGRMDVADVSGLDADPLLTSITVEPNYFVMERNG